MPRVARRRRRDPLAFALTTCRNMYAENSANEKRTPRLQAGCASLFSIVARERVAILAPCVQSGKRRRGYGEA